MVHKIGIWGARNDVANGEAPTRLNGQIFSSFLFSHLFATLLSPFLLFSRRHLRPLHRALVHGQRQGPELVQEEGGAGPGEQRGELLVVLAEARRRQRRGRHRKAGCSCCCCPPRRQGQARRGQGSRASGSCSCCSRSCCCCSGGAVGRRLVWRRRRSQQCLIIFFIYPPKNKKTSLSSERFSVGPLLSLSSLPI